jgi:hypothetical protein
MALLKLSSDCVRPRENPGAIQSKPGFFSTHPCRYSQRWLCRCAE